MHRNEFIKLSINQKTEALWDDGDLVFEKVYYEYDISLFLLGSFYVEVFFNRHKKEIDVISVQDDTDILFAYVKDLSLAELAMF